MGIISITLQPLILSEENSPLLIFGFDEAIIQIKQGIYWFGPNLPDVFMSILENSQH